MDATVRKGDSTGVRIDDLGLVNIHRSVLPEPPKVEEPSRGLERDVDSIPLPFFRTDIFNVVVVKIVEVDRKDRSRCSS